MKKLKTKEIHSTWDIIIGIFLLLISFVMLYVSTATFHDGFHNVDLAHNFAKIRGDVNQVLIPYNATMLSVDEAQDNSTSGLITLSEGYRVGIIKMRVGNLYMFLSGVTFLLGLILLLFRVKTVKSVNQK